MVSSTILVTGAIIALASQVSAHATIWLSAMWGFNKSDTNRPQDPLINLPFSRWWFHGYLLDYPPHPGDIEQLPVGGSHTFEISCDKDATSFWESGPGGNQISTTEPDSPCPGQPSSEYHTNSIEDVGGCALAVAYKSDATQVEPEDFTVFSVNQTCVWYRYTSFQIPKEMPQCPDGKCICAWFWIHRADSGSEQNYMTAFQCNMQGATSTKPLPPARVPRRCGADAYSGIQAVPSNCTYGAKQPFYWYQAERNNMFEGTYEPPLYRDLYNFRDGSQDDIFEAVNSSDNSSTQPSGGTTSPVPANTLLAGDLPMSSSPSPAPSPSPSSPPSSPSDSPAPSPSPPPSSSSSSPAPPPPSSSSPPAGDSNPSDTSPTPNTSSWSSYPSQPPSLSPSPTDTTDPEHTSKPKPKNPKCKHNPNSPKPSAAYRRAESLGDAPARRVWGHHRRSGGKRDT